MHQENRIQQEMFIWYTNNYCTTKHKNRCLIAHIPNENQHRLVNIGVLAGFSDLIVMHVYNELYAAILLYIEVKVPGKDQSPKQIEFQQRIEALGYEYYVVRGVEDLRTVIQAVDIREKNNPSTRSISRELRTGKFLIEYRQ